jgi:radical SAM superfamily enzyme YgiQ (UPF0313 family)
VRALLLSTYELGHQPLHVASPAGALLQSGHEVRAVDLAVDSLDPDAVRWAELVAVSVPMHTALRLARQACAAIRRQRPEVPVCFYGLYAGVDDGAQHPGRADISISGEYEPQLLALVDRLSTSGEGLGQGASVRVHLGRTRFSLPARHLLPPLERYARLVVSGEERLVGYVEASHGCIHRCRHCPVPVVYDGRTRVVPVEALLADVEQLVQMGAGHLSFGDPDFLSGPHHARRVVAAVHQAFPALTFDITTKVSHILAHGPLWPELAGAGCLFVVSAFESASDDVLAKLDKGHTVADEIEAVAVLRDAGIEPRPSFLPFTPWSTARDVAGLVELVEQCDLIGNVDPVQYSIRLLVPPGSLLLDSGGLDGLLGPYDTEHLGWTWTSPDPRLDRLQERLSRLAEQAAGGWGARQAHEELRDTVTELLGASVWSGDPFGSGCAARSAKDVDDRPRLTEPWFCCAEPTQAQLGIAGGAGALQSVAPPVGGAGARVAS